MGLAAFFFFIALQPRFESYKRLRALNTSPLRNQAVRGSAARGRRARADHRHDAQRGLGLSGSLPLLCQPASQPQRERAIACARASDSACGSDLASARARPTFPKRSMAHVLITVMMLNEGCDCLVFSNLIGKQFQCKTFWQ